jgi:hypothetical protein
MGAAIRSEAVIELVGSSAVEAMRVMSVIVDAHARLSAIRDRMVESLKTIDPTSDGGKRAESLALQLSRCHDKLTSACAFMPDEFWFEFVSRTAGAVGLQEIARKLSAPSATFATFCSTPNPVAP